MAMMGVTAYRQLLRTSKMRTAGAPAPEESAAALQHVSKHSKQSSPQRRAVSAVVQYSTHVCLPAQLQSC